MDSSKLIIIGIMILSFLGLLVGFYYFYPLINEERYAEISSAASESDSTSTTMSGTSEFRTYDDITNQIEYLLNEQLALQLTVDSLNNLKEELIADMSEIQDESTPANGSETGQTRAQDQEPQNLNAAMGTDQMEGEEEAFTDRVKSLLNLEEEELAPILAKLNNDQLTKLYRSAGNIQREKVLRSLNPERAARLMELIML